MMFELKRLSGIEGVSALQQLGIITSGVDSVAAFSAATGRVKEVCV